MISKNVQDFREMIARVRAGTHSELDLKVVRYVCVNACERAGQGEIDKCMPLTHLCEVAELIASMNAQDWRDYNQRH